MVPLSIIPPPKRSLTRTLYIAEWEPEGVGRKPMASISVSVVEPALRASVDPLAGELLARLREQAPTRARATRPYPRRTALELYQRKAAKGDKPWVRTDGYAVLLAALAATPENRIIVHGITFTDAVYLVFTDPSRRHCLGLLRKRRLIQDT